MDSAVQRLRVDVCALCDLRCPACVQTRGGLGVVGRGWMPESRFARLLDRHPEVRDVELSNWGEIFLNPELEGLLEAAYARSVALWATNGVHFNRVSGGVLKALVRSGVRAMTVSIDGATQETYEKYRRGGRLERVLDNVGALQAAKREAGTTRPLLTWQFIVFGHNEHEVEEARSRAESLGMRFRLKLSSDAKLSPVRDLERLRAQVGASSREEWEELHGKPYFAPCEQLWREPQVNWDGRLLGCCINRWEDFGNVIDEGLQACVERPRYVAMQDVVKGNSSTFGDLPCHRCGVFQSMRRTDRFFDPRRS